LVLKNTASQNSIIVTTIGIRMPASSAVSSECDDTKADVFWQLERTRQSSTIVLAAKSCNVGGLKSTSLGWSHWRCPINSMENCLQTLMGCHLYTSLRCQSPSGPPAFLKRHASTAN